MKIGVRPGHPHYEYPPQYDAQKINRGWGPIYEGGLDDVAKTARDRRFSEHPSGIGYEYIIFGVQDIDAPSFLAANGTTITMDGVQIPITAEVITKNDILIQHGNWVGQQTEKITDQSKVLSILAKVARKEELTIEEKKALDPSDPTPGIGKSKSLEESLDEFLAGK